MMLTPSQHTEFHATSDASRLNWLRASVLGANDGIVSVASLMMGVAGASSSSSLLLTAGIAGTVAGALSMAVGEYVSVSSQRDTEEALLEKERRELAEVPERELEELTQIYVTKGLSHATALIVARELTAHDAFRAHADAELSIDPDALTDPWHAAFASGAAFTAGAVVPVIASVLVPSAYSTVTIVCAVTLALVITGALSAYVGGASKSLAMLRVVFGGLLAMLITYGVGMLFGVSGV